MAKIETMKLDSENMATTKMKMIILKKMNINTKKIFLLRALSIALSLVSLSSFTSSAFADQAQDETVHLEIAPVIGYQSLQRTYPYNHTQGMLTYGARVVVGTYKLAGEAEFQVGSATENFSNPQSSVDSSFAQIRVGARKILPLIEQISLLGRLGMQGSHFSNTYTDAHGVQTSDSPSWQYRPYVGAGLIFYLFKSVSISVEEVYVVDTSWETGFGFRLYI